MFVKLNPEMSQIRREALPRFTLGSNCQGECSEGDVAHPTTVLWTRDPHTEAKHEILKRYLQAWWPILLQSNRTKRLTFLDGFAGPGEYENGPEGSPCIALRTLCSRSDLIGNRQISFVFIEENSRRKQHLENLIGERIDLPPGVSVIIEQGRFEQCAIPLLNRAKAWGSPIFANLDTWGVGDIPFPIVKRICSNPSSEAMTTFLPEWFVRFGNVDDPTIEKRGQAQFASASWRQALSIGGDERMRFLVEEYQKTLRHAGASFAMPFALSNFNDYTLYLIFATGNRAGVEKMKDAMWNIDPVEGTSFKDPRDPNQMSLGFNDPDLASLKHGIIEALRDTSPQSVSDLKERFFSTMYKPVHVSNALRELRDSGRLDQHPSGRLIHSVLMSLR